MSPTTFSAWDPSPPTTKPPPPPANTAIVLTGAVAQGAFAAGALDALAHHHNDLSIARIVATSSGALSATLLAAGVHAGRLRDATSALIDIWTRDAHWNNAVALSPRAFFGGRGLSTSRKVRRILRREVTPFVPGTRPIELRLIMTALAGDPTTRQKEHASSFESMLQFSGADFDTPNARERLFTAATAAAAFPALYAPVHVPELGACLDGGATNNAPIGHALDGCALRRVIIIANTPPIIDAPPLHGTSLAEHLAGILTHERLFRDLRTARRVNRQLAALDQLAATGVLAPHQLAAVRDALDWRHQRHLEILEIRPPTSLRGGAFAALGDRALRVEYIEQGRRAAERMLGGLATAAECRVDRTTQPTSTARRSR